MSLKDAMKLSDEKLIEYYGSNFIDVSCREYVEVRYNLLKNPYYSMMPLDELKKTPRSELLKKLDKEYSINKSNRGYIVALLEDLIRLQILEKQTEAAKTKPQKDHPDSPDQAENKVGKIIHDLDRITGSKCGHTFRHQQKDPSS